jgi:hypothetical protein
VAHVTRTTWWPPAAEPYDYEVERPRPSPDVELVDERENPRAAAPRLLALAFDAVLEELAAEHETLLPLAELLSRAPGASFDELVLARHEAVRILRAVARTRAEQLRTERPAALRSMVLAYVVRHPGCAARDVTDDLASVGHLVPDAELQRVLVDHVDGGRLRRERASDRQGRGYRYWPTG